MDSVKLKVSYAPFVRTKDSIESVMYNVALALAPATVMSIYLFGMPALLVTVICIVSCIGFEWLMDTIRKKPASCLDGSAFVTGLLLALNVPSNLPIWMLVVGSFIAIAAAKHVFGGLGHNIFNPALVARVFLLVSFPAAMTSWPVPFSIDMQTAASPLGILKTDGVEAAMKSLDLMNGFYGTMNGSMGETSALALLAGAAWLFYKRYITIYIPFTMLGSVLLFSAIFHMIDPSAYAPPLFHLVTGGLILGAFFMATDMVTSPLSIRGQVIFGLGCGLLTAVIRLWGGYPEGVSFAILIMNGFVPLIDNWDLNERKAIHQKKSEKK
ncbi:MAG: RnfABCDGE type electron transport complex subunit D [Chlorobium sp.]|jgi:electron transport complex protein RnfD|uniref:RnfABCDGE type electron transport complex subunit D n=1 Tax=Chlorobium sp. TaxID=1095 RepID=UPI0025C5769B|nr:RnfABCDGE type electron transport complex subunit D [Chlorobium sp.]MCF8216029.1 RnfABCDGE type electron transport complex subunit D [Chlorobium sp.]MCF8270930.1 RnfABCDGE type electron transport complex subunit D [Chlorobium sp.]MCF8287304.1 RnfABCDGE type electron transport complex subunit D [Chlorobium sp.]MCF8291679.1 RnfABCDGE type electron transport complex subunit D [Chlorobium sp.]MCF8384938.1 RnfABCDGE type electron transport complex subunit D [Chlorobium sp.]